MNRKLLTLLLALLPAQAALAHAVWLEQDAAGTRAYFGEFAEDLREPSGGRLDAIKAPRLIGTAAAAKLSRNADHLAFAGLPAGDAWLIEDSIAPRDDKQAGGKTRSIYNARSGRASTAARLELELVPAQAESNNLTLLFRGQPLPNCDVVVIGPPRWEKTLRTDPQGRIAVPTPWAGRYVLEVKHVDAAGGELDGVKYDRTRYVATLSFSVAQGLAWPGR